MQTSVTIPSSVGRLLSDLDRLACRARLLAVEIDTIAVSLSGGLTDSDGAIAWLIEAGGLDLIAASSAVTSTQERQS